VSDKITWPDGKDFAFTVFDDTDRATVENVSKVYEFLNDRGFLTTKSVWPGQPMEEGGSRGSTCEDEDYVSWLKVLQEYGFEIGYHSATFHESERSQVKYALERFYQLFGHYPRSMAQHTYRDGESLYWGNDRLSGLNALAYKLLTRNRSKGLSRGHIEGDTYFWGDLCKEKVKYMRDFTYPDINTLKVSPMMPYHDPKRPYVNYWFQSSEGANISSFNKCISEENQDLLEAEGGACIMYTHFAFGFYENGSINARFDYLMERLSRKNGWFVPVSDLLDYLLQSTDDHMLTDSTRTRLGRKWLFHKIRAGQT
jgi:hypothetical protein